MHSPWTGVCLQSSRSRGSTASGVVSTPVSGDDGASGAQPAGAAGGPPSVAAAAGASSIAGSASSQNVHEQSRTGKVWSDFTINLGQGAIYKNNMFC
jgi:hypothetical protein